MPELVLEIRCQEMSPALANRLIQKLGGRLFEELMSRGITMSEMATAVTPRRLALGVLGLPEHDVEREKVQWGPAASEAWDEDGQAKEALLAFAEECGVDTEELSRQATERGERAAWVQVEEGRPIAEVLHSLLKRLLKEVAATMPSLGGSDWPVPITGLLALVDGELLPLEWSGLGAKTTTVGHPILSPTPIVVSTWSGYVESLSKLGLRVGRQQRREHLLAVAMEHAKELAGSPLWPSGLVDRWTDSCEIPGLIHGEIVPEAMALPRELMITVLAARQGAVALERGDELLPFFMTVMDREDDPDGFVQTGRERSVAGDLIDALLAYERDRLLPLVQRGRRLDQLTFHERLGTYADKGQRLRELVELACQDLGWDDVREQALEAAALAKADLTTSAVESFPSLRGIMGGILAREEGYVEPVWQAIYDHTRPVDDHSPIPRGKAGQLLAVADRLGTLVGFFGLGDDEPDGRRRSADPHGLRPRAQGLLRLIIEADMGLDLDLLAARAVLLYGDRLEHDAESILRRLQTFLDRRLDHLLGARGFRADEIEACKAVGTRDLPDLVARLEGLRALRGDATFQQLVAAAERMAKIVVDIPEGAVDVSLLAEGAEKNLHDRLETVTAEVEDLASARNYEGVLRSLLTLVPTLEAFFAEVLIRDEDDRLRANRVALIHGCRRQCWRVARLGALEVGGRGASREEE